MPSQYSELDNKPIDQWKVIELREELRRRNLGTKGLKEELVKRLDEAIKKELESENEKELGNGDEHIPDPQNDTSEENPSLEAPDTQATLEEDNITDKDIAIANISHGVVNVNQGHETQNGDAIEVTVLAGNVGETAANAGDFAPGNQNFTGQTDPQGEDDDLEKFEESNSPLVGIEEKANAGDLENSSLVNQNITVQSDIQRVEELKTPIVGTEEKEATTCGFESCALVNHNITVQSDTEGVDTDLKEIFDESKTPTVGTDERSTIARDFEGSALVNQNITVQSDTQCVDADLKEIFEDSKTPIVGTDEKEATTCDWESSAVVNQNITVQNTQVVDAKLRENFEESKTLKDSAPFNQNTALSRTKDEDAVPREKFEESKADTMEFTVIQSEQHNQVSEVNQGLGFQVKYKSNCTDSVSIIEKNNIKDNLTADHFPLELVVKQEVVQPSSSSFPASGGHSYMVVDEQEAAKDHATDEQVGSEHQVFVGQEVVQNLFSDKEEINIGYATNEQHVESMVTDHPSFDDNDIQNTSNFEVPKKEDCVESGSPEKLNLDRSSGDESMEEDMLDSKHMEVDIKSEERTSKIDVKTSDIKLEERATDVGKSFSELKEIDVEDVKHVSLTEKRKLEDAEVVVSNGAPKRHRRWNPDTIKVPEQQSLLPDNSTAPKNNLQPPLHRTFSRSNSTISVDSPKERIVPTPKKPATTSLRIDNFLRPFTLKAVQELLGKTGRVCDFWMDHIKTHCFVTFSSVEEATETRNAVYNLQWPPNGGRFLAADFVDPQEVKLRSTAAPPPSPVPINSIPSTQQAPPSQQTPHASQPTHHQNLRTQPQAHSQHALATQPIPQQNLRPQLPPPPPLSGHLPPPPSLSLPTNTANIARERLPPPPPQKKPEPPVMTLDDLFKKTRATPRIYYLPLTEEQARAKLAEQQCKKIQL